ncbi:MAG TPA: DUF1990 domain-containing protein, partial [Streptosporangiaceae bacterium]|nr:DUF1990 domain-containing protein [Streptosporangiaceae bacterium]
PPGSSTAGSCVNPLRRSRAGPSRPGGHPAARAALRHWAAHEGAGVRIFPHGHPVFLGATILAVISLGPAQMVAPCRIVRVIDESDRFGFACGTLPGHPERGEEAFVVERRTDGTFFSITAFSRPADPLARLAGPIGRAIQLAITRRFVNALARYTQSGV